MAKKIESYIRLQVPAGQANPSPPVGPVLGQRGVNIMEFCKQFNARTQNLDKVKPGTKLPVVITVFSDKSFTFILKKVPATDLLKEAANIQQGSSNPNTNKVARLTRAQLEEIAKYKMSDLTAASLEAAVNTLAGSARSMGIEVVGV